MGGSRIELQKRERNARLLSDIHRGNIAYENNERRKTLLRLKFNKIKEKWPELFGSAKLNPTTGELSFPKNGINVVWRVDVWTSYIDNEEKRIKNG